MPVGPEAQIARIERKIVEHHVAVVDAEGGTAVDQAGHDVVAQVVELLMGLRLGVGYEQRFKLRLSSERMQSEIDGCRQRPRSARRLRGGDSGAGACLQR